MGKLKIFPIKMTLELKEQLGRISKTLKTPIAEIIRNCLEYNVNLDYYEKLAKHYDNSNNKESV
jgi:predicted DNA-binding protein